MNTHEITIEFKAEDSDIDAITAALNSVIEEFVRSGKMGFAELSVYDDDKQKSIYEQLNSIDNPLNLYVDDRQECAFHCDKCGFTYEACSHWFTSEEQAI